jgi:hypothetical protein
MDKKLSQVLDRYNKMEKMSSLKNKNSISVINIKDGLCFMESFNKLKKICATENKIFAINIKEGNLLTWKK